MKKSKQILSALLCAAMMLAFVPAISVSASEYSGTCGNALRWTLDTDTGILTINGTGAMTGYDTWGNIAPWYNYGESITSIIVSDGVTSIGSNAFVSTSLTSITIPNSVTSIGNGAFVGCTSLTSVTIPSSVTSIGSDAFSFTSLTSITIPNSVTSIGDLAFGNCISLTSITIPNSVTNAGNGTFYWCTSLESITIPDSVTSIGNSTFYGCKSLASVTIPDSITSIGDNAFNWCKSLESIAIPNSVTNIGDYAFAWCDALTDVYYGGSEADWSNMSIGEDNEYLTNATIHYNSTMPTAEQNSEIAVTLNGSAIEFDQPPVIVNGRTLVPLRAIFEALGASVEWDGETQTVTAEKDGTIVILTVGQTTMYVNGEAKTLDAAPQLVNSRTLVPARAIAEAFGCSVDWDNETRTVVITQ